MRRDDDGRFVLGLGLIALGRAAADAFPLAELARPVLVELRDATGESVQLFVREGDGRRCVVSLQSAHGLRWIVPEGAVFPLRVGSAGRVLAGETGPDGWVASVEEREAGVASVSAPVRRRAGRGRRRGERQRSARRLSGSSRRPGVALRVRRGRPPPNAWARRSGAPLMITRRCVGEPVRCRRAGAGR